MAAADPIPSPAGNLARVLRPKLPLTLTSFVGRDAERVELARLLTSDEVRVVTLTGPGGIGKTRLALELVPALRSRYTHGAGFVQLASLRDASLLPISIAGELDIPVSDAGAAKERLLHVLHNLHALMVFDNAEHLIRDLAPLLSTLLRGSPDLTALVTSREPLGIYGEWVFPLQALDAREPSSSPASIPAAVQLFADRAAAHDRHFTLTPETTPIIAEICARLDGIPLAIELAASRLNILSPAALLARLQHRLPMLTSTFLRCDTGSVCSKQIWITSALLSIG